MSDDESTSTPDTDSHEPERTTRNSRETRGVEAPPAPRWLTFAALLLAVIGVALGLWSLFAKSTDGHVTALPGDAKTRVCAAFDTVSEAVPLQTHTNLGPSPVAQAAVAANARLALLGGGVYLENNLDSATPPELADPVRDFARELQEIGANALAGATSVEPVQSERMANADRTRQRIADMCA